jgi:hypothetical protein
MPILSYQDKLVKQQKISNLASSVVALLSCSLFPLLNKRLSCVKMSELLTSTNTPLDIGCLQVSCKQATKIGSLECRMFGKASIKLYRLTGIETSLALTDERGPNWILPKLPNSFFVSEQFLDHVKEVNDFISFTDTICTTTEGIASVLVPVSNTPTPAPKKNSTSQGGEYPNVTPSPINKGTCQKACQGWKGEKFHGLFQHSFNACTHCEGLEVSTPTVIALSPIYKEREDFSNLAFFAEDDADDKKSYVLRSRECTRLVSDYRSSLCLSCGSLKKSVGNLHAQASEKVVSRPDTRLTCQGWKGEKFHIMFQHSFDDCVFIATEWIFQRPR